MTSNFRNHGARPKLSEAIREPGSKLALGRPHDAYATVCVTLAVAALIFVGGRMRVEVDWVGWTGFAVALAALFAAAHYFRRAYGFSSRGFDDLPRGAVACTMMFGIFGMQFIPAALYNQYFEQGIFGYSVICLTLAVMIVGPLRVALGEAPQTNPKTDSEG